MINIQVVLAVLIFLWIVIQCAFMLVDFHSDSDFIAKRQLVERNKGAFRGSYVQPDPQIALTVGLNSSVDTHSNTTLLHNIPDIEMVNTTMSPLAKLLRSKLTREDEELVTILHDSYLMGEKKLNYVGNTHYMNMFPNKTDVRFQNSLAVFPGSDESARMHGLIGLMPNGSSLHRTVPLPPAKDIKDALKRGGGFYLEMSDSLPLDRSPPDNRDPVCHTVKYDLTQMEDSSVIITFYNEPISTLLRSIHSVLNRTPPPLLREIILVDDHSNRTDVTSGGELYDALALLPKVTLLRLPKRMGLVQARLAGIRASSAPIIVVLDSHIEVNEGWLEPQMKRLAESPRSIVMPQIDSIDAETFKFTATSGIGCWLSFKWVIQERATLTGKVDSDAPIASPSMAGGLFAVRKDWFWELGGYDEEFTMWGAENVEIGFRAWMCGGMIECTPCARVYHIYRKGGVGYKSPPEALWKNRLRTGRVWMDEYFTLTEAFNYHPGFDIGKIDHMLELKQTLGCHDFTWYLNEVVNKNPKVPTDILSIQSIKKLGEIRNEKHSHTCIDSLSHDNVGDEWGTFGCHNQRGTQGYLMTANSTKIVMMAKEIYCLGVDKTIEDCSTSEKAGHWSLHEDKTIRWQSPNRFNGSERCLSLVSNNTKLSVEMEECNVDNAAQKWQFEDFVPKPYVPPDFSPEYKQRQKELKERRKSMNIVIDS